MGFARLGSYHSMDLMEEGTSLLSCSDGSMTSWKSFFPVMPFFLDACSCFRKTCSFVDLRKSGECSCKQKVNLCHALINGKRKTRLTTSFHSSRRAGEVHRCKGKTASFSVTSPVVPRSGQRRGTPWAPDFSPASKDTPSVQSCTTFRCRMFVAIADVEIGPSFP